MFYVVNKWLQVSGRVWFDDRRGSLVLAGQWRDDEGQI